jgi:hypothetical protein
MGMKVYTKLVMIMELQVGLVNFATSKTSESKVQCSHITSSINILGCLQKAHNQIDHILVDRQRLLNIPDIRSYKAVDCDSDYYLVVTKVRERLAVNEQRSR